MLIMPQDDFAEVKCLSACFWSEESLEFITKSLEDKDFIIPTNREIFRGIKSLMRKSSSLDAHELILHFKDTNLLGIGYEQMIMQMNSNADMNYEDYVRRVKSTTSSRKAIEFHQKAIKSHCERDSVFDEVHAAFLNSMQSIMVESDEHAMTAFDVAEDIRDGRTFEDNLDWLKMRFEKGLPLYDGVVSGYEKLSAIIGGFQRGTLTYIGARSHMGKTTFMLNLIASISPSVKVGVMSLEMTVQMLYNKLVGMLSRKKYSQFSRGHFNEEEKVRLKNSSKTMREGNVVFQYVRDAVITSICNKAKKMLVVNGIEILFIDYLTLIRAAGKHNNAHMSVNEISKSLQTLAKQLNIPVVCLAQLNRNSARNPGSRPTLLDFRESGSIEEDADTCLLLHRPDYYDITAKPGILEVNIAKNRIMGELKTLEFQCYEDSESLYELGELDMEMEKVRKKTISTIFTDDDA